MFFGLVTLVTCSALGFQVNLEAFFMIVSVRLRFCIFIYFEIWRLRVANYYVSKSPQANGHHEVHASTCLLLPLPEERLVLGYHESCKDALEYARLNYRQVTGCKTCSRAAF